MTPADLVDPACAFGQQHLSPPAFASILRIDAVPTTQDRLEAQWEMEVGYTVFGSTVKLT
jgi:hypothetical protein